MQLFDGFRHSSSYSLSPPAFLTIRCIRLEVFPFINHEKCFQAECNELLEKLVGSNYKMSYAESHQTIAFLEEIHGEIGCLLGVTVGCPDTLTCDVNFKYINGNCANENIFIFNLSENIFIFDINLRI